MVELKRSMPTYRKDGPGFFARDEAKRFDHGLGPIEPHPGLVFDKYLDTWLIRDDGACSEQKPSSQRGAGPKAKLGSRRTWLAETIECYEAVKTALTDSLNKALKRQGMLVQALDGQCRVMKTDWRLVSGLGSGHPFETGFIYHRTLGVPYLPGSSVKGLVRAWADPRADKDGEVRGWGDPTKWDEVKYLFGDTEKTGAGALIVFDALPLAPPKIELDIMNPHYMDYYSEEKDGHNNPIPPADYLSPNPIFFLAVAPSQSFRFALAPRSDKTRSRAEQESDLQRGVGLLEEALASLGVGGKTAVGYGCMSLDEEYLREEEKDRAEEERLRLEQEKRREYEQMRPEQRQVWDLKVLTADPAARSMDDKKNELRNLATALLKDAARWSDPADRKAAAEALRGAYDTVGWGKPEKRREKETMLEALASSPLQG